MPSQRHYLKCSGEGIAAIPHVDALICQQKDRERVCEVIGRQIFEATGVCCTVGGTRYSPLTEIEEQALAFDEAGIQDIPHEQLDSSAFGEMRSGFKIASPLSAVFVPISLATLATRAEEMHHQHRHPQEDEGPQTCRADRSVRQRIIICWPTEQKSHRTTGL